jgi:hypothetical protein
MKIKRYNEFYTSTSTISNPEEFFDRRLSSKKESDEDMKELIDEIKKDFNLNKFSVDRLNKYWEYRIPIDEEVENYMGSLTKQINIKLCFSGELSINYFDIDTSLVSDKYLNELERIFKSAEKEIGIAKNSSKFDKVLPAHIKMRSDVKKLNL